MPAARLILIDAEDEDAFYADCADRLRAAMPSGVRALAPLRLRDCGAPAVIRRPRQEPIDWTRLGDAVQTLVARARAQGRADGDERVTHTVLGGLAPLPVFALAGCEFSAWTAWSGSLTLVHKRKNGPWDTLALDGPLPARSQRAFKHTTDLAQLSLGDQGLVAVAVSTDRKPDQSAIAAFCRDSDRTLAGTVELRGQKLVLTADNVRPALAEIQRFFDELAGLTRAHELAVFIDGPASLAFLVGHAINPNVFGVVHVPNYVRAERRYEPALTLPWPPPERARRLLAAAPAPADAPLRPRRPRVKILHFSANPEEDRHGRRAPFDEEPRAIQSVIDAATHRRGLRLVRCSAVRIDDVQQGLSRHRPAVAHFGGHGLAAGLVLQRDADEPALLSADPLRRLLAACTPPPRLVVLNACGSDAYAPDLAGVVDCVIGMPERLEEDAAVEFARAFYHALACAHPVQAAYDQACAVLDAHHFAARPCLCVRTGVDASRVLLVTRARSLSEEIR